MFEETVIQFKCLCRSEALKTRKNTLKYVLNEQDFDVFNVDKNSWSEENFNKKITF